MLTNHQTDADQALIATVEACIALDKRHAELTAADLTDGADPELAHIDEEIERMFSSVLHARARTLAGAAAKGRLFRRLFPEAEVPDGDAQRAWPVDAERLGSSISRDIELFAQTLAEPANAA